MCLDSTETLVSLQIQESLGTMLLLHRQRYFENTMIIRILDSKKSSYSIEFNEFSIYEIWQTGEYVTRNRIISWKSCLVWRNQTFAFSDERPCISIDSSFLPLQKYIKNIILMSSLHKNKWIRKIQNSEKKNYNHRVMVMKQPYTSAHPSKSDKKCKRKHIKHLEIVSIKKTFENIFPT